MVGSGGGGGGGGNGWTPTFTQCFPHTVELANGQHACPVNKQKIIIK